MGCVSAGPSGCSPCGCWSFGRAASELPEPFFSVAFRLEMVIRHSNLELDIAAIGAFGRDVAKHATEAKSATIRAVLPFLQLLWNMFLATSTEPDVGFRWLGSLDACVWMGVRPSCGCSDSLLRSWLCKPRGIAVSVLRKAKKDKRHADVLREMVCGWLCENAMLASDPALQKLCSSTAHEKGGDMHEERVVTDEGSEKQVDQPDVAASLAPRRSAKSAEDKGVLGPMRFVVDHVESTNIWWSEASAPEVFATVNALVRVSAVQGCLSTVIADVGATLEIGEPRASFIRSVVVAVLWTFGSELLQKIGDQAVSALRKMPTTGTVNQESALDDQAAVLLDATIGALKCWLEGESSDSGAAALINEAASAVATFDTAIASPRRGRLEASSTAAGSPAVAGDDDSSSGEESAALKRLELHISAHAPPTGAEAIAWDAAVGDALPEPPRGFVFVEQALLQGLKCRASLKSELEWADGEEQPLASLRRCAAPGGKRRSSLVDFLVERLSYRTNSKKTDASRDQLGVPVKSPMSAVVSAGGPVLDGDAEAVPPDMEQKWLGVYDMCSKNADGSVSMLELAQVCKNNTEMSDLIQAAFLKRERGYSWNAFMHFFQGAETDRNQVISWQTFQAFLMEQVWPAGNSSQGGFLHRPTEPSDPSDQSEVSLLLLPPRQFRADVDLLLLRSLVSYDPEGEHISDEKSARAIAGSAMDFGESSGDDASNIGSPNLEQDNEMRAMVIVDEPAAALHDAMGSMTVEYYMDDDEEDEGMEAVEDDQNGHQGERARAEPFSYNPRHDEFEYNTMTSHSTGDAMQITMATADLTANSSGARISNHVTHLENVRGHSSEITIYPELQDPFEAPTLSTVEPLSLLSAHLQGPNSSYSQVNHAAADRSSPVPLQEFPSPLDILSNVLGQEPMQPVATTFDEVDLPINSVGQDSHQLLHASDRNEGGDFKFTQDERSMQEIALLRSAVHESDDVYMHSVHGSSPVESTSRRPEENNSAFGVPRSRHLDKDVSFAAGVTELLITAESTDVGWGSNGENRASQNVPCRFYMGSVTTLQGDQGMDGPTPPRSDLREPAWDDDRQYLQPPSQRERTLQQLERAREPLPAEYLSGAGPLPPPSRDHSPLSKNDSPPWSSVTPTTQTGEPYALSRPLSPTPTPSVVFNAAGCAPPTRQHLFEDAATHVPLLRQQQFEDELANAPFVRRQLLEDFGCRGSYLRSSSHDSYLQPPMKMPLAQTNLEDGMRIIDNVEALRSEVDNLRAFLDARSSFGGSASLRHDTQIAAEDVRALRSQIASLRSVLDVRGSQHDYRTNSVGNRDEMQNFAARGSFSQTSEPMYSIRTQHTPGFGSDSATAIEQRASRGRACSPDQEPSGELPLEFIVRPRRDMVLSARQNLVIAPEVPPTQPSQETAGGSNNKPMEPKATSPPTPQAPLQVQPSEGDSGMQAQLRELTGALADCRRQLQAQQVNTAILTSELRAAHWSSNKPSDRRVCEMPRLNLSPTSDADIMYLGKEQQWPLARSMAARSGWDPAAGVSLDPLSSAATVAQWDQQPSLQYHWRPEVRSPFTAAPLSTRYAGNLQRIGLTSSECLLGMQTHRAASEQRVQGDGNLQRIGLTSSEYLLGMQPHRAANEQRVQGAVPNLSWSRNFLTTADATGEPVASWIPRVRTEKLNREMQEMDKKLHGLDHKFKSLLG